MSVARNSIYGMAGTVLPLVASVVTIPLYVEHIGPERYGALSLVWLFLMFAGQADFGIGRAVTQRIAGTASKDPQRLAEVVWTSLALAAAVSAIVAALIYAAAWWYFSGPFQLGGDLRRELVGSIWLLALSVPVVVLTNVFWGALAGLERFGLSSFGNFVGNLALAVVPLVVAIVIGPHLENLIVASLVSRLAGCAIMGIGVWLWILRGQRVRVSRAEARGLSGFGTWMMMFALLQAVMAFADRFEIGFVLGAAAVTAFAIPWLVASRTQLIAHMIAQALYPRLAADPPEAARLRSRDYFIFVGQLYAPITIALICLAAPLMRLWLGEHLDPRSVAVGQILMLAFWIEGMGLVPLVHIQARGAPKFIALFSLVQMPLYLAAIYVFAVTFGLVGVAVAWAVRLALSTTILVWRAQIFDKAVWRRLAIPSLLVAGAMALGPNLHDWVESLAAAAVLSLAATVALVWQMPEELRRRAAEWPIARRVPGLAPRPRAQT